MGDLYELYIRFLVGPYEECGYTKSSDSAEPPAQILENTKNGVVRLKWLQFQNWFRNQLYLIKCGVSHSSCPHPNSCSYYLLEGCSRKFLHGYVIQLCIKVLMNIKHIVRRPSRALKIPFWPETFRLAVMFSVFCGLFRGLNCWGRRLCSADVTLCAVPAGFAAGLTFFLYRDNTIALYFMWKLLQLSYNFGTECGYLPEIPYAPVIFHAASTAVLFQTAVMEPKNLRPSYWNFLDAMSGGKIAQMGREGFDAYGLESSKQLQYVLAKKRSK